jgi:hypothetical protein
MPAINAKNSSNLTIENCNFIGFETAIELENVTDFVSKNNQFSQDKNPKLLLIQLSQEINNSGLDKSSKERLAKKIIEALASKDVLQKNQDAIKGSLKYVGDKAVDFFVQLSAAVIAGLMVRS